MVLYKALFLNTVLLFGGLLWKRIFLEMIWNIFVGESEVKLYVILDTGAKVRRSYLLITLNRKLKKKKKIVTYSGKEPEEPFVVQNYLL